MTTPLHNVYEYSPGHDPALIASVATSADADALIDRCIARREAVSGSVVARFDDPEAADGHPGHVVQYAGGDTAVYRVAATAAELSDTLTVHTLDAAPVPASDRPGAQQYRATLTRDAADGPLVHLDVSTAGGWRNAGEPLTPAAARALAATLNTLADHADQTTEGGR